jgi:hypothetical protein
VVAATHTLRQDRPGHGPSQDPALRIFDQQIGVEVSDKTLSDMVADRRGIGLPVGCRGLVECASWRTSGRQLLLSLPALVIRSPAACWCRSRHTGEVNQGSCRGRRTDGGQDFAMASLVQEWPVGVAMGLIRQ